MSAIGPHILLRFCFWRINDSCSSLFVSLSKINHDDDDDDDDDVFLFVT